MGIELYGRWNGTRRIAGTFQTADTLVVVDHSGGTDRDIHGTRLVTRFAIDTCARVAAQFEYPEQIPQSKHGSIGTGIFAERTLHE